MKKILKSSLLLSFILLSSQLKSQTHVYAEYNFMLKDTEEVLGQEIIHSVNGNSIIENKSISGISRLSIYLKANDSAVYAIGENKTYYVQSDRQLDEYVVQILGEEKIGTYNCTKLAIATHDQNDLGQFVWISADVPNYEYFLTTVVNNIRLEKLRKTLVKEDLEGVIVKIISRGNQNSYQFELNLIEKRFFDKSVFELSSYTERFPQSKKELKKNGSVSKEQYKVMKQAEKQMRKLKKIEVKRSSIICSKQKKGTQPDAFILK